MDTLDRYTGCLVGLACGDAVGTTVEFQARGSFEPLTDMVGGGPFQLNCGEWTDDTSMALCLAHSLAYKKQFDAEDQMNRYCNWANFGYMSSNGSCFDIGNTVSEALRRYQTTKNPFAGSSAPETAGNGGIMRLAPVAMFYSTNLNNTLHYCAESSRTTHGAQEAIESASLFGAQIRSALLGNSKTEILFNSGFNPTAPKVMEIAQGTYTDKSIEDIKGSGYVISSLEAALWCFLHTETFRDAVLYAANLGDDADTTAAIVGQLAGAYYGIQGIPQHWRETIVMSEDIVELATELYRLSQEH